MLSNIQYSSLEQLDNPRHYRSNRSSPAVPIENGYRPSHLSPSTSSSCSAHFITRVDLTDYTLHTLKQTIDSNVPGPKIKGLKVKLSLPDEGLIIENVLDANQSWMYRTSELLYFWRDPFYPSIVVVITLNRVKNQAQGPFSCSIFRLRGNDSVQFFLQRAQQFFAQLSSSNGAKNGARSSIERSFTADHVERATDQKRSHRKRSHHQHQQQQQQQQQHSNPKKPPARTEFIPEQSPQTNSIFKLYHPRTYSETTISSDSQKSTTKKITSEDIDDKMTSISNQFSNESVLELVRELKQLRSEIAFLKLEPRITPTRSTSTSPLTVNGEKLHPEKAEVDAETQTDLHLIDKEWPNGNAGNSKRKNDQINTYENKRTLGKSNKSEREEVIVKTSSPPPPSSHSNGFSSSSSSSFPHGEEDSHSSSYPQQKSHPNGSVHSEASERKEMDTEPLLATKTGDVVSFRSSFEDTIPPPENIYENVPMVISANSHRDFYYKTSNTKEAEKPQLRITLEGNQNSQLQQQYLSQLFGPENGISLLLPPQAAKEKSINVEEKEEDDDKELVAINTPHSRPVFQQVRFSDHLTNPLFNVDRQLLSNTIANQFEIESNSPYLQKLIDNQHLFVAQKRTFANMVWQMTPEEENLLCSSPLATSKSVELQSTDSKNASGKPILKQKKSSRSLTKGRRISWDNALD